MSRLIAALSGGVDSAVAAARMVAAGHQVTGVHLALSRHPATHRVGARGCCSLEDANDARRVADVLGLPYYVWDFSEEFHQGVVTDFLAEYAAGRTPNPCLRCNELVKFAALLRRALDLGFDGLVTGHYARLRRRPDGLVELLRAVDQAKDQSYVLGVMTQDQLQRSYFPLGDSTKPQVRAEAARLGLTVADKPDSSDICFIPDGDTAGWLHDKLGRRPGPILDAEGTQLGHHQGAFAYTIGQRRGLRLGRPAADGRPRYVTAVDPARATVTVGPRAALRVDHLSAIKPLWCDPAETTRSTTGPGFAAQVQLRAHGQASPAWVRRPTPDLIEIDLLRPALGVAPGQTAVLYDDDRVLGSATIDRTWSD
ncbi:MAG: tRNA 2-thiouridine(34) synthase MnmA [Propionibacteriaceae bacterium]|jgi:tRNA-specific 2-thiouridylase|nr:tRNA 2-thiouridine(34) synthase MnmA [Propionibacteriaceae bacterium]